MSKKTRNIIIAVAVLLALVIGALVVRGLNKPAAQEGGKTITITVVHKDGSTVEKVLHTDAENLMDALLEEEGFVEGEGEGSSFYVTTVDGEAASWEADQAYWAFTKDGVYMETGAHDTMIADGDHYEFTYTVSDWG